MTFPEKGSHPLADTICALVRQKLLVAASVGFIPLKMSISRDPSRPLGLDITEQSLLEWSVVNVPANPECLVQARSLGIATWPLMQWAEKLLDAGGSTTISKMELEALRAAADEKGRKHYSVSGTNTHGDESARQRRMIEARKLSVEIARLY